MNDGSPASEQSAVLPHKVTRREKRGQETRSRIFHAALQLFADGGFSVTTIEAITSAADVGKGTFFNYFESKESLLLEFREMQMAKVRAFVTENLESDAPLATLLHGLAVSLTAEEGKRPGLAQSLLTAVFANQTVQQRMAEGMDRSVLTLAKLIERRQQSNEIRDDLDPLSCARVFQRMVFGTMVIWSLAPTAPLEENLKITVEVFVHGIQSR